MYPILATVQWENHGIYMTSGEMNSGSLKEQLGNHIGDYKYENYKYELYEMKGEDTDKCILVKNNQVYLKYNFLFKDTITFNNQTYVIGENNAHYIKGNQIGNFGINKVYEIKSEDTSKVIDVYMSTKDGSFQGDFTAYRHGN